MWTYQQESGELRLDGELVGKGYSGRGAGKNNPQMQDVANVGPIPRGRYLIGRPSDTETHGPLVMPLTACDIPGLFGRNGFLIHGESKGVRGEASYGSIVLPRGVRERIAQANVELLEVV